jgi:hypothetical protein
MVLIRPGKAGRKYKRKPRESNYEEAAHLNHFLSMRAMIMYRPERTRDRNTSLETDRRCTESICFADVEERDTTHARSPTRADLRKLEMTPLLSWEV